MKKKKYQAPSSSFEAEPCKMVQDVKNLKKKILTDRQADLKIIEEHFKKHSIYNQHPELVKKLYEALCLYKNNYYGRKLSNNDLTKKIKKIKNRAAAFQKAMNDIGYTERLAFSFFGKGKLKGYTFNSLIDEIVLQTERTLKALQQKEYSVGHPADSPRIFFINELLIIYYIATGKKPGIPWRRDSGEFDGPFYRFCEPFFPREAGSGLAKAIARVLSSHSL